MTDRVTGTEILVPAQSCEFMETRYDVGWYRQQFLHSVMLWLPISSCADDMPVLPKRQVAATG